MLRCRPKGGQGTGALALAPLQAVEMHFSLPRVVGLARTPSASPSHLPKGDKESSSPTPGLNLGYTESLNIHLCEGKTLLWGI